MPPPTLKESPKAHVLLPCPPLLVSPLKEEML